MTSQPERHQSFPLIYDGQPMIVCFTPYRFSDYGHFEFRSPHSPPRRIPVSETGYRSHFAPMQEIEQGPDIETYVKILIRVLINQDCKRRNDESQPDLFD